MPIPKPHKNESEDDFIDRCMANPTMVDEYPTNQRFAICQQAWDDERSIKRKAYRSFVCDELRANGETASEQRKITGHAAVFNSESVELFGFREMIAPGAFVDSIGKDDIRALFNHNPDFVLGRNRAGTLKLHEDERGLAVEISPPDTQAARDVVALIERGDVTQMSFGFYTIADAWDFSDKENPKRTLTKVQLFDVSPVTYPAYEATDVEVNSLEAKLAAWQKKHPEAKSRATGVSLRAHCRRLRLALANGR